MTQSDMVLEFLREHKSTSKAEIWKVFGFTKGDTLISLLRKDGYNITSETVRCTNRYGVKTRYTKYTLIEEAQEDKDV